VNSQKSRGHKRAPKMFCKMLAVACLTASLSLAAAFQVHRAVPYFLPPRAMPPYSARVMAVVRHGQFGRPPRTQCATALACGCRPHDAPGRISGH